MNDKLESTKTYPPPLIVSEIGKTPWKINDQYIDTADGEPVCSISTWDRNEPIANLLKESPSLYECLREACIQTCLYCRYKQCRIENKEHKLDHTCIVKDKWMAALARARGEMS